MVSNLQGYVYFIQTWSGWMLNYMFDLFYVFSRKLSDLFSSVHSVSFIRCFVWSPRCPERGLGSGWLRIQIQDLTLGGAFSFSTMFGCVDWIYVYTFGYLYLGNTN